MTPVVFWFLKHLGKRRGSIDERISQFTLARFDDTDRDVWILSQASSDG